MNTNILTQILKRFTIYLQDVPSNLRLMCHTLLFFLVTLEIALTIYNNIDNPQFNYIKWGKTKILKIGFILFALNKYEWLMEGIKNFFFYAVEKAIRASFFSNDYFESPSLLYNEGYELAKSIYEESVSFWHISSWPLAILSFLILIGFLIITIQLIICWIEFYFLTGFSIIFLPFGALDLTTDLYKNVFKTIMSCSIKLGVMNFWLVLSTVIIKDLVKISSGNMRLDVVALIFGTIYVLVAIMQFLPSMASSLLSGSPTLNANAAMSAAIGAGAALGTKVIHTAKMVGKGGKGAWEGGKIGWKGGNTFGGIVGSVGGPGGSKVGNIVGATVGATVGSAIGGSYAAGKYGINQWLLKKPEYSSTSNKPAKESSKKSKDSSNSFSSKPSTNVSGKDTKTPDYSNMSYQEILQSASNDEKTNLKGTDGPTVNGENKVPDWMQ